MKCVCGYETNDLDYFNEEFSEVDLRVISTWPDKHGDMRELENGTLKVYICPKCGTLKIKG